MKKLILVFAPVLFLISCNGQSSGLNLGRTTIKNFPEKLPDQDKMDIHKLRNSKFYVSEIMENDEPTELQLSKIDPAAHYAYGNTVTFKADGTFRMSYSAKCGNDCFPFASGNYFFSDATHILIQVKNSGQGGDCMPKNTDYHSAFVRYYVQSAKGGFKLIPSNGNYREDERNAQYSDYIDKFISKMHSGSSLLDFKTSSTDNATRVKEYVLAKTKIKNYRLLYMKKADNITLINLVQDLDHPKDYWIVVNGYRNNYNHQVGGYKMED